MYIKYGNESCNFFGYYKLKPIDYDAFFKSKWLNYALTSIIGSSTVAKKKYNNSTTTSTSIKDKYDEVSGKIAAVNEPPVNQSNYDTISIELTS